MPTSKPVECSFKHKKIIINKAVKLSAVYPSRYINQCEEVFFYIIHYLI